MMTRKTQSKNGIRDLRCRLEKPEEEASPEGRPDGAWARDPKSWDGGDSYYGEERTRVLDASNPGARPRSTHS